MFTRWPTIQTKRFNGQSPLSTPSSAPHALATTTTKRPRVNNNRKRYRRMFVIYIVGTVAVTASVLHLAGWAVESSEVYT